MDRLVELRQALKPMVEAQGLKLSYLPLMVKVRTPPSCWPRTAPLHAVPLHVCLSLTHPTPPHSPPLPSPVPTLPCPPVPARAFRPRPWLCRSSRC
jgi:hypothetical protein